MQLRFDERVVIVTGAAQGIGRAIAAELSRAGAWVHLSDRDAEGLAAVGHDLGLETHPADLAERAQAHAVTAAVIGRRGRLDVLVNAAGGVRGQAGRPIEDVEAPEWRALFEANVDAAFWMSQAAAHAMKAARAGRIVNIASGAGLRPSLTGIQAYTAAKHALVGLTRQLSSELGPHGITVNAVAPGFVPSNPDSIRQWESYGAAGQQRLLRSVHTRRIGRPEDIAAAVAFLASDAAGWISGEVLAVDGGRS